MTADKHATPSTVDESKSEALAECADVAKRRVIKNARNPDNDSTATGKNGQSLKITADARTRKNRENTSVPAARARFESDL